MEKTGNVDTSPTDAELEKEVWGLLVVNLPASYLQQKRNRLGDYKTSAKSLRLRDGIVALVKRHRTPQEKKRRAPKTPTKAPGSGQSGQGVL